MDLIKVKWKFNKKEVYHHLNLQKTRKFQKVIKKWKKNLLRLKALTLLLDLKALTAAEKEREIKRIRRKQLKLHHKVTIKFRKIKGIRAAKIINKKMKKWWMWTMNKKKFSITKTWVFFRS